MLILSRCSRRGHPCTLDTLLFYFFSAQAIKCYQCFGAICGDPFDATMVLQVDCPGLCEKTKVTGFISKDAEALNQVKVGGKLTQQAINSILTSY